MVEAERQDVVLAMLSVMGFDSFMNESDHLLAYIEESSFEKHAAQIKQYLNDSALKNTHRPMANRNWNALWEASFQPVFVDDFVHIRASFHDMPTLPYEHHIVIDPQMAFGTGHHQTTSMMIACMRDLIQPGMSILDFGCGSGILSILAKKMASCKVVAIDHDVHSVNSTNENARLNDVKLERIIQAGLEVNLAETFDLILANVNRHVIINGLDKFYELLQNDGKLLISGVLESDSHILMQLTRQRNWRLTQQIQQDDWICQLYEK